MILTIQLASPKLVAKPNGFGYELFMGINGHHVQLQIGDVSVAFDGRNNWQGHEDGSYSNAVMQFSELHDCPIRLDNEDCPPCDDTAETLLFALAANLGYTLSK